MPCGKQAHLALANHQGKDYNNNMSVKSSSNHLDRHKSHEEYLAKVRAVSGLVDEVLKSNPQFDRADLYRIAMKRYDTPEQKLAAGLRRRKFGHVTINN